MFVPITTNSTGISFEVLQENREQISDFRDNNLVLSIIIFWLLYVSITSFSLPGAAVASVSGGFLFGLGLGVIVNVTAAYVRGGPRDASASAGHGTPGRAAHHDRRTPDGAAGALAIARARARARARA